MEKSCRKLWESALEVAKWHFDHLATEMGTGEKIALQTWEVKNEDENFM
jgi:hypothetical protein